MLVSVAVVLVTWALTLQLSYICVSLCRHGTCEQVLFVHVVNGNPAPVNRSMQFYYCTVSVSNPGTGADDAFVSKAACGVTPHGLHTADWQ